MALEMPSNSTLILYNPLVESITYELANTAMTVNSDVLAPLLVNESMIQTSFPACSESPCMALQEMSAIVELHIEENR